MEQYANGYVDALIAENRILAAAVVALEGELRDFPPPTPEEEAIFTAHAEAITLAKTIDATKGTRG